MADASTMPPTPSQAHTPFYLDKSFYLVGVTLLLPLLNKKLGWELDANAIVGVCIAVATFIFSSKRKSAQVTVEEIKAKNAVEVAQATSGTTYKTPEAAARALDTLGRVPNL